MSLTSIIVLLCSVNTEKQLLQEHSLLILKIIILSRQCVFSSINSIYTHKFRLSTTYYITTVTLFYFFYDFTSCFSGIFGLILSYFTVLFSLLDTDRTWLHTLSFCLYTTLMYIDFLSNIVIKSSNRKCVCSNLVFFVKLLHLVQM